MKFDSLRVRYLLIPEELTAINLIYKEFQVIF